MKKTKLTAIVPVYSVAAAKKTINQVADNADCIELRLDFLEAIVIEEIKQLLNAVHLPCIITLRSERQGGNYSASEAERFDLLKALMTLQADYIDLESDLTAAQLTEIAKCSNKTKIICSHHDFQHHSENLDQLFSHMKHPSIYIYKLITTAKNSIDSLRMLNFVCRVSQQYNIVGHCMGEAGLFSRVAGAVVGNYFTYAAIDAKDSVVSHQITLEEFRQTFKLQQKNTETKLYALIGDPVRQSLGDVFHNQQFSEHQLNALYVKIKLTQDELPCFFQEIKALPFYGFSVTMPLKKVVLPYIENVNVMPAVNTLKVLSERVEAINTDGLGALKAINEKTSVSGKRVVILGAGGAAVAIAQTLFENGAIMTIANRTIENAEKLASNIKGHAIELSSDHEMKFDVLVNTLPISAFKNETIAQWCVALVREDGFIMDINYHQKMNPFIELAEKKNVACIDGKTMFQYQALAQLSYWFDRFFYFHCAL